MSSAGGLIRGANPEGWSVRGFGPTGLLFREGSPRPLWLVSVTLQIALSGSLPRSAKGRLYGRGLTGQGRQ